MAAWSRVMESPLMYGRITDRTDLHLFWQSVEKVWGVEKVQGVEEVWESGCPPDPNVAVCSGYYPMRSPLLTNPLPCVLPAP